MSQKKRTKGIFFFFLTILLFSLKFSQKLCSKKHCKFTVKKKMFARHPFITHMFILTSDLNSAAHDLNHVHCTPPFFEQPISHNATAFAQIIFESPLQPINRKACILHKRQHLHKSLLHRLCGGFIDKRLSVQEPLEFFNIRQNRARLGAGPLLLMPCKQHLETSWPRPR